MKKFVSVVLMLVVAVMFNGSAYAEDDIDLKEMIATAHKSNFSKCDNQIRLVYYDNNMEKTRWSYANAVNDSMYTIQFYRYFNDGTSIMSVSFTPSSTGCNILIEKSYFLPTLCSTEIKDKVVYEDKDKGVTTTQSGGGTKRFFIPEKTGCLIYSRLIADYSDANSESVLRKIMAEKSPPSGSDKSADNKAKEEPKPQPEAKPKPQFRE